MRWVTFICGFAVALCAAPPAHAAVKLGRAVLASCNDGVAVFEGRVTPLRRAVKTQMRFTLEARTPDEPTWRRVPADGFGTWITAPPKVGRYLYDKRVEQLIAPADYRAVVQFRWRDAKGHTVRSEHAITKVCRQPDPRPDLEVSALRVGARYVALLTNRGRGDAGPFSVAFTRNGQALGSVSVDGLAAGATTQATLVAPACAPGELIAAQADAGDAVDEADEDGNVLSVTC